MAKEFEKILSGRFGENLFTQKQATDECSCQGQEENIEKAQ